MLRTRSFPSLEERGAPRAGSTVRRVQRLQGMPVARRILGIDPGLHITGYGVIELEDEARSAIRAVRLIEGGVLRARATDTLPRRIETLYDGLREILREHSPDVVVIEELFSTYAHPRSALLMAHARGAFMLAAQQSGAQVHSFLPNEVKQCLTGNGHATKSAMQQAVRARLRLAAPPNPPDVADALAIALCFADRQTSAQSLA
jgi:crossover junction endodeoxyribonuclease RuvC